MKKEFIGYVVACPCCGDPLRQTETEDDENGIFVVYEKKEDAFKEALNFETEDGQMGDKIVKVKLSVLK
jgi:hypothetical protein